MTIHAEVRYRDYVGPRTIALEFLEIEFSGNEMRELEHQWHELYFQDARPKLQQLEELESKLKDMEEYVAKMYQEYEELKDECTLFRNWFNKELKAKRDEALELYQADVEKKIELEEEIENFEVYDSVHKLISKKNQFLTENGFRFVTSHFQDNTDITVEMWIKE